MRAALYRNTGPAAEVLHVEEIERPQPGPEEVLVRVRASGVNPTDYKSRAGMTPRPIDGFQIPHQDGAGVIEAVGPGVDPGRVGERVWLWLAAAGRRGGSAAGWSVLPGGQGGVAGGRLVRTRGLTRRSGHDRSLLPVRGRPSERPDRASGRRRGGRRALRY